MNAISVCTLTVIAALHAVSQAQSLESGRVEDISRASAKEKLIGAWHLLSVSESGAEGGSNPAADMKGTLIYTRDGHMSVQIMYPASAAALSNDYVLNGYEASFGSYDVDEQAHTITHHVQGSLTTGLVGKDLTRVYQLSDGHLIIKSTRPDEHWSVMWEHY